MNSLYGKFGQRMFNEQFYMLDAYDDDLKN